MSDSNTPVEVTIDDDLDAFSDDFFGQKSSEEAPASAPKAETDDEVADALEPTDTPVEDTDGTEEDEVQAEDEPEVPAEPKLTPTQKRINEVVGKQRAAERALEAETAARRALEARIAELTSKEVQQTPTPVVAEVKGPTPSDTNEDGTDKYPLGEFDPQYQADLVHHLFNQKQQEFEENQRKAQEEARQAQANQALVENWNEKLGPAKERYPDFDEAGQSLINSFNDLDPAYGNYLASTLMDMEFGPDVLYYLSQNPDEANRIVASGATRAVIALGRIEAKFAEAQAEKVVAKPRVSQAPTPPPQNKGNNAAVVEVADDTDDLDAFTAKLFKKR